MRVEGEKVFQKWAKPSKCALKMAEKVFHFWIPKLRGERFGPGCREKLREKLDES